MKILVTGGRNFKDKAFVWKTLDKYKLLYLGNLQIVQGGAKGVDHYAWQWAHESGIPCKTYKADWDRYGKAAGYIRNKEMLLDSEAQLVLAFPGGRGTRNMVHFAHTIGVQVIDVMYESIEEKEEIMSEVIDL